MKGLSQEELGKLLHISRQTISKWESNQSSPDIQSCKAMADVFGISLEELLDESKKIKTDQSTNHRNMIIIFGIVIFLAFIMESYVAVKMSERMDALEEANSSLQQQINDFYGDQPILLDTNSICSYFSGYISDIKKDSYNINIDLILRNYQDNTIAQVIFKTDKDTYTLSLNKEEGLVGNKMPVNYVAEMLCDRVAACEVYRGKNYTSAAPMEYYEFTKKYITIHPETRALLEKLLTILKDEGEESAYAYIRKLLKKGSY